MERLFSAENAKKIDLTSGEVFRLETLRVPVVPPYLMIIPFIEFAETSLQILEQVTFEGEGVHGCTYRIRALSTGIGTIRIGFRDVRSSSITHEVLLEYTIN
jgi:hypothetical protein